MALCYKDMTFCKSDCENSVCNRFISEELKVEAHEFGLPLAVSDFSKGCLFYLEPKGVKI